MEALAKFFSLSGLAMDIVRCFPLSFRISYMDPAPRTATRTSEEESMVRRHCACQQILDRPKIKPIRQQETTPVAR